MNEPFDVQMWEATWNDTEQRPELCSGWRSLLGDGKQQSEAGETCAQAPLPDAAARAARPPSGQSWLRRFSLRLARWAASGATLAAPERARAGWPGSLRRQRLEH